MIYPYWNDEGLRYYAYKYSDFIKNFGKIAYIELVIDESERMTFNDYINKISPQKEKKWIEKNYSVYQWMQLPGFHCRSC